MIVATLLLPNAQTGALWLFVGLVICAAPAFAEPLMGESRPKKPSVAMVYCEKYEIHLGGLERLHAFDIHKYSKIQKQLLKDKLLHRRDFYVPAPLTREQILLVHTEGFLQSLKTPGTVAGYLEAPIAGFLSAEMIDRNVLAAFRHASGGTIVAARLALEHGIAVNLGGGYHHAKPAEGEGFCVYADMPIAIRTLQREKRIRRALVVDLDVHQGNGTIVCCKDDPTVFTFSMHQRDIYPVPKEKGDLDIELDAGTNPSPRAARGDGPRPARPRLSSGWL
jgi:histone deacetylase 11